MEPVALQQTLLLPMILLLPSLTTAYTVEDIRKCPCQFGSSQLPRNIIHPTNCTLYFYCTFDGTWERQSCPTAGYHFNQRKGWCVEADPQCSYEGRGSNIELDLSELYPVCKNNGVTVIMPGSSTVAAATTTTTTTTKGGSGLKTSKTTTILAALLGVTFFILISVILVIFLYKWRQKLRRPRHFYTGIPRASSIKRSTRPPPSTAANVIYTSNRNWADEVINSEEVYETPMSEEAGYMEIPERTSKAYYSEPSTGMRPPLPLPVEAEESQGKLPNEYDGEEVPQYTVTEWQNDGGDGYAHPDNNIAADNHIYTASSQDNHLYSTPDTLAVDEPYEYCRPESAHPTLSFRRDNDPLPPRPDLCPESDTYTRPESPPYYVDPIADGAVKDTPHKYHTLESLTKGTQ